MYCMCCFVFYAVKHELGQTVSIDNINRFKNKFPAISILTTNDCASILYG